MGQEILNLTNILIISGLLLILAELIAGVDTGFDLVLVGSILIISGLLNLIIPSPIITLIFAAVLSAVYIFFGRKLVKQKLVIATKKTNVDELIGKNGLVLKKISAHNPGRVKIESEQWRARSDEIIDENEKVEVVSVEGVTLNVKRA